MRSRIIIPITAAFLCSVLPFLTIIPVIGYLLQIVTALAVLMAVVEQRVWFVVGGFIVAVILGSLLLGDIKPVSIILAELGRDILAPLIGGVAINQGRRAGSAFMIASVVVALSVLWMYFQTSELLSSGITTMYNWVEKGLVTSLQSDGYGVDTINALKDNIQMMSRVTIHLTPAMLILSGMVQVFIAFLLVEWYYLRRDSYFPGFGSFLYWKAPEYLLYIFGVTAAVRLIFGGAARMTADNILLMLSVVFCVTGLSFFEHLLRRLRLPMFFKIIFYIGLFIAQLAGYILAVIAGLFDSFFDFRKTKAHTLG